MLKIYSRRNLPLYQRAVLALKLKPIYEERAKENLRTFKGNQYTSGTSATLPNNQNNNRIIPVDTRKELAKTAGVSHDTIHKVETIEKNNHLKSQKKQPPKTKKNRLFYLRLWQKKKQPPKTL